jgi:quercetin dioxygenase-like cupin family protein
LREKWGFSASDAKIPPMNRHIFLFLLPTLLFAQTAPEVEITGEPHHHLVFSNDQVRVFAVEVPPHSATLMHRHDHDYFYVVLGAADISNEISGQPAVELKLADGEVRFSPGPFAHLVRDLAEQPFHNVTVELLQDEKLRRSPAHWDQDRGLNILQGGTQEVLFVKDGVRASEFELQPGGAMPRENHSGPLLLIALSDFRLWAELPKNAPRDAWDHLDLKSASSPWISNGGSVTWISAGRSVSWSNNGKQSARFVTLEFP